MPPIPNDNKRLSDWLAAEADMPPFFCREEINVAGGEQLRSGALLGAAVGGEYAAWAPGEEPGGFLISDYVSGETSGPQPAVALVRGPATIKEAGITWPDGTTDPQKETAKAALAELGIVFRQSA